MPVYGKIAKRGKNGIKSYTIIYVFFSRDMPRH